MFHQFLKTQRPLLLHAKQLGNGSLLFYFCPKWLRGVCKQMLLVCSYQSWIHIGISWLHRCLFGSCSGPFCSRQHDGIDFFWQPQRTTNKNKLLQKSLLKLINSRFAIEFVKVSIRKNFQNLHLGPLSKVIMEGLVLLACEHEHLLARHVLGLVESTAMKCQEVTWKEPQRNQCGQALHDVVLWGSEFAKMTMLKMARAPRIEATVPTLLCRLLTCFCWKQKVSESCDSRFQL